MLLRRPRPSSKRSALPWAGSPARCRRRRGAARHRPARGSGGWRGASRVSAKRPGRAPVACEGQTEALLVASNRAEVRAREVVDLVERQSLAFDQLVEGLVQRTTQLGEQLRARTVEVNEAAEQATNEIAAQDAGRFRALLPGPPTQ